MGPKHLHSRSYQQLTAQDNSALVVFGVRVDAEEGFPYDAIVETRCTSVDRPYFSDRVLSIL